MKLCNNNNREREEEEVRGGGDKEKENVMIVLSWADDKAFLVNIFLFVKLRENEK